MNGMDGMNVTKTCWNHQLYSALATGSQISELRVWQLTSVKRQNMTNSIYYVNIITIMSKTYSYIDIISKT